MMVYDNKTRGTVTSGTRFVIDNVLDHDDILFKASYVVAGDLVGSGKVSALFDLIVLGKCEAAEINIKGRFVCLGSCKVEGTLIVSNDIWAESIEADTIICHDRIMAQSIDAVVVETDANIIIGKILAIEEKAKANEDIMCGETAFGAGKLIANRIITAEPLDLDDGEEALEDPYYYKPSQLKKEPSNVIAKYSNHNDFKGLLAMLMDTPDSYSYFKYKRYLMVLNAVEEAYPSQFINIRDVSVLIWMIEIAASDYFSSWEMIHEWLYGLKYHFDNIIQGKVSNGSSVKPATKLEQNYVVVHKKYGRGVVTETYFKNEKKYAIVNFDNIGIKKFPLPGGIKFFGIISENGISASDEINASLCCDIKSYDEWLTALHIINQNAEYLGTDLYDKIYDMLFSMIGLKSKYVKDRFKEKGWR